LSEAKPIGLAGLVQDGNLSAEFPAARQLLLYGQSGRSPARAVDRADCSAAGGVSRGAGTAYLRDRSRLILPDHLHAIWALPDGDADFATRWRLIKCGFSHALPAANGSPRAAPPKPSAEFGSGAIGSIRCDGDDFARHLDYIHFNPVKHGHAIRVQDWPFSSFRRWVRLGAYPADWAGDSGNEARDFGAR
jgi:hypothetical protein